LFELVTSTSERSCVTHIKCTETGTYSADPGANPVAFAGGAGSGAAFTLNFSVIQVALTTPGSYTVLPGPFTTDTTTPAAAGATVNITYDLLTGVTVLNPGAYEVPPNPQPIGVNVGPAQFTLTYGGVAPATPPADLATPNLYADVVAIPANFTVNDLSVTLNIFHPHLDELDIKVVSPTGVIIQLIRDRTDGFGNTVDQFGNPIPPSGSPAAGITGANLGEVGINGVTKTGFLVSTVFDDNAARLITDPGYAAPYTATFRAEGGNLDVPLIAGQLGNSPNISGPWQLIVTDHKNDGELTAAAIPIQRVDGWTLNFSHISTTGFGADRIVGGVAKPFTTITSAASAFSPYPLANTGPYGPAGVVGVLSVAVDNTLGAFSPFQGRVYIGYTGGGGTNTNVFLTSIDNLKPVGLPTWNAPVKVNDDVVTDNFSEGNRPQFMPTIAVDNVTGTVGVMYYDGRWDASINTAGATDTRAANSFSDSIDGGLTFSPSTTFNTESSALNAITFDPVTGRHSTIDIEPVPGNQGKTTTSFGFGDRQGLVMFGGHVIPVFSSNENAAGEAIKTAQVTIAAGPRILSGDMGPITADFKSAVGGATYNNTFAADGTRQFNGFVVTFDRPIDISTFTSDQVTLMYRDTVTSTSAPGVTIPNTNYAIIPLNAGGPFGLLVNAVANALATTFLIKMLPGKELSGVGTYSYAIGNLTGAPKITDGFKTTLSPTVGNFMDQNQNTVTGELPGTVSFARSATVADTNFSSFPPFFPASTGAKYSVGDILTVVGGTFTKAAQLKVTTVDNANGNLTGVPGSIIQVALITGGSYTAGAEPGPTVTVSGGSGSGANFTLAFVSGGAGDVFAIPAPTNFGQPFSLPLQPGHAAPDHSRTAPLFFVPSGR
jgi:hypothetical protein